mgnify:FL=1
MIRKIVEINEELCNGCGAIAMINGKAKLIKDDYCDGFGDCLPACPTNAISIIEREADDYNEEAVKKRMEEKKKTLQAGSGSVHMCPGSMARALRSNEADNISSKADPINSLNNKSRLMQWPVQIKLVPINAPYFENANLLIAADCTAYAYANFHEDFIKNHITLVGCPKLDEGDYSEKLGQIISQNNIKSIKIVRMEVPCCGGLEKASIEAMRNSGKMIRWQVFTITCDGKIKED